MMTKKEWQTCIVLMEKHWDKSCSTVDDIQYIGYADEDGCFRVIVKRNNPTNSLWEDQPRICKLLAKKLNNPNGHHFSFQDYDELSPSVGYEEREFVFTSWMKEHDSEPEVRELVDSIHKREQKLQLKKAQELSATDKKFIIEDLLWQCFADLAKKVGIKELEVKWGGKCENITTEEFIKIICDNLHLTTETLHSLLVKSEDEESRKFAAMIKSDVRLLTDKSPLVRRAVTEQMKKETKQ